MTHDVVLEMDIGNSLAKWRVVSGGAVKMRGTTQTGGYAGLLEDILNVYSLNQARIASVADESMNKKLRSVLQKKGIEKIGFAKVTGKASGVTCGYKEMEQLGIDRWLAILAAAGEFSSAFVVVDFGTAVTLDFVDERMHHQGGYIVPGWSLLQTALVDGTAIDSHRIPDQYESEFIFPGRLTRDAIGQGRLLMLSALVESAVAGFSKQQQTDVMLVCTGGDAPSVISHIQMRAEYRPDLVLDGLKRVDMA